MENLKKSLTIFQNLPKYEGADLLEIICINAEDYIWHEGARAVIKFSPACNHTNLLALTLYKGNTSIFESIGGNYYKNIERFPEIFQFIGSWEDACTLVLETMKKNWPELNFPRPSYCYK